MPRLDLSTRSSQKELLDGNAIPAADIRQNMRELNFINTWLGGHAITLAGFRALLNNKKRLTICEIGCGGGDNLRVIDRWCQQNGISISLIGIDYNEACIGMAQEALPAARFICSDYKQADLSATTPDIIFSSLFCHHFSNEELICMLKWMRTNASSGFFINDLHRHFLAYYSIKILTALFSGSYLVKHDAPLSVARGFSKQEWLTILDEAGMKRCQVRWKWAFRWLITASYA